MGDDDLDAVVKLEHESHLHPWSLELFRRELDNPLARIDLIYAGPVLAGYLCSWLVADEMEIQNVAISPRFRRQGLARRLIDHVLLRARKTGAERILLEVRAGNVPARELYRQCGFEECGLRRGYYPDGEDAVLMVSMLARLS
jgi:ribosomal-protein-alanine N-acetyltransferase